MHFDNYLLHIDAIVATDTSKSNNILFYFQTGNMSRGSVVNISDFAPKKIGIRSCHIELTLVQAWQRLENDISNKNTLYNLNESLTLRLANRNTH